MVEAGKFVGGLKVAGVEFFAGVPDLLLKSFCAYVTDTCVVKDATPPLLFRQWGQALLFRQWGQALCTLAYEYSVMNALATDASVEFVPMGYYHSRGFLRRKLMWIGENDD